MPIYRTLEDFGDLLPAETQVLAEMHDGPEVALGPALPALRDGSRKLRAEFVAFLARGGGEGAEPPPHGLHIMGGWITGQLDLRGPAIDRDLGLIFCRFDAAPNLRSARLVNLFLNGSHLPGLYADGLEAMGGVFLRQAVIVGEARFPGARLGGDLDCVEAQLENAGSCTLRLQGARVDGALFLRDGAVLRGALDMTDASFGHINDDRDSWPGPGDLALNRCRYEAFTGGPVDARSRLQWLAVQDPARLGHDFWPQPYEQLAKVFREMGHTADACAVLVEKERRQRRAVRRSLRARLDGAYLRLRLETAKEDRRDPLLAAGDEALEALGAGPDQSRYMQEGMKTRFLRQRRRDALLSPFGDAGQPPEVVAARARLAPAEVEPQIAARGPLFSLRVELVSRTLWDYLVGAVVGYGRRPGQAFLWLLGLWLLGALIFGVAAGRDAIAPNQILAFRGPEWVRCNPVDGGGQDLKPGETRRDCFHRQPEAASYQSFNALIYSLDAMLPIINLGMEDYWIPDESAPAGAPWIDRLGWWTRAYLWLHIFAGWGLSLLAVAGFSGLVKTD